MTVDIAMFIISLAALYHAWTFAAYLREKNNNAGSISVYVFIVLALILLGPF